MAGLVAGGGAALLVDRRTGLVYSEDELKSLMPCPLIKHLPAMAGSVERCSRSCLPQAHWAQTPEAVPLPSFPIGSNIPNEQLQAFSAELKRVPWQDGSDGEHNPHQNKPVRDPDFADITRSCNALQLSQLRQKLALQGLLWLAGLLDPGFKSGVNNNFDSQKVIKKTLLTILLTFGLSEFQLRQARSRSYLGTYRDPPGTVHTFDLETTGSGSLKKRQTPTKWEVVPNQRTKISPHRW